MLLRQSTAVTVMYGPLLSPSDGVTPVTGQAGAGTEISKAGGTFATGPVLGTHAAEGWYPIDLTTGHTDTLGILKVKCQDAANYGAVWEAYQVIDQDLYDILLGTFTLPELSQAQPPTNPTIYEAIMLVYMHLRDETDTDGTYLKLKNNAGTVIAKTPLSEVGGVVIRGKMVSGP